VALLAAELCGDREERAFDISHTSVTTREYDAAGFELTADITADRGVDVSSLSLFYSVDGGAWQEAAMASTASNDTYAATIPAQPIGSVVDYYFVAHDLGGVELMSPMYAPYDEYTFSVTGVLSDPPTADAGADAEVSAGASYQFDGAGSDDDVGIDNYTWAFTDVTARTLYGVSPSYVFDRPGSFTVTLTVKDADAQTDTDQVLVTVVDDTPPVADAGTDHLVMVGGSVSFEGSLSDDNVAIVSYEWKFVYNGSERTLTGVSPDFTFWTVDEYVVTLNVTDAAGNYDTDTVTVTVEAAAIPEFSGLLVPVTLVMVAFLVLMRRSRSGAQK
jgi:PKD repeat protein